MALDSSNLMLGYKEMNLPPGEYDFSPHRSEQGELSAESSETPHLPEGQLMPIDFNQVVALIDDLAENSLKLSPKDKEQVEQLYTITLESYFKTKLTLQNFLKELKWEYAYFKEGLRLSKDKKLSPVARVTLGLSILSLLISYCTPRGGVETEGLPSPASTVATSAEFGEENTGEESISSEPTEESLIGLNIDYGDYAGREKAVNEALAPQWQQLVDYINANNLALPNNIKIIDISEDNILVEILQTGRADDYPLGTTFTISRVRGHEGELLGVTVAKANEEIGGSPVVKLAIGANGLPVGLNNYDLPVVHVSEITGDWEIGGVDLAPEVVPQETTAQETSESVEEIETDGMPMEQVAELYLTGEIGYPVEFDDGQRGELGAAITEYLNEISNKNGVHISMSFDNVGEVEIGWNPTTERWVSNHNTPESDIDFEGKSLPPMIISGYTNADGREVIIADGQEIIVPEINLPEMGPISITQLYAMSQSQLQEYAKNMMLEANGIDANTVDAAYARNYLESNLYDPLVLPVIIFENARNNPHYYQNIFSVTTEYSQVPEADTSFVDQYTNSVLIPIIDQKSNQVFCWLNVQQGVRWEGTQAFVYSPSTENINFYGVSTNTTVANNIPELNDRLFGFDSNHSFGFLLPGETTDDTYRNIGGDDGALLEKGIGVGSEEEISLILKEGGNPENFAEIIKDLNLRLFAIYPKREIHQSVR